MFYYQVAGVTLASSYILPSFEAFVCEPLDADVTLEKTGERPPQGRDLFSGTIAHRRLSDGWFYHAPQTERKGLYVSSDYGSLKMLGEEGTVIDRRELLMSQCFIPMWDTDTALVQMENIVRLAGTAEIVRAYCGSSAEDAVRLYDMLGVL